MSGQDQSFEDYETRLLRLQYVAPEGGQIACEDSGFNTQLNEEGLFLMTGDGYYLPVVLARVFGKRQYTSQRAEWMT